MITSKEQFFKQLAAAPIVYALESGETIELVQLSLGQRSQLIELTQHDSIRAQATIVTMACPFLADGDVDAVLGLPGAAIAAMADKVMEISGLKTEADEDDEKKSGPANGASGTDSPSPSDEPSVN